MEKNGAGHKYAMIVLTFLCLLELVKSEGPYIGFTNIYKDSIAQPVVLEYGEVPAWINGTFIRHACGGFGETGSDLDIINKVEHLFDCLEMGQSFSFDNGNVTFWNRYWDTTNTEIWRHYEYNMNNSLVYWPTVYAQYDYDQWLNLEDYRDNSSKLDVMPHVAFWQMGDKVLTHSEKTSAIQVDPHVITNAQQEFAFNDDNFGYTDEITLIEIPHEMTLPDGTFWANHMAVKPPSQDGSTIAKHWRNVFSVSPDGVRETLVRILYPDIDLSLCTGDLYPNIQQLMGYTHSMGMTENYLIIPESSFLVDPCELLVYDNRGEPGYESYLRWEEQAESRLWFIRQSDGVIMANITLQQPFFNTHQLNSYEDGDLLYVDMVTYNNSDLYTLHTYVHNILTAEDHYETYVERFIIDTSQWSIVSRTQIIDGPLPMEMPNINRAYTGKRYKYAYILHGIYTTAAQILMKINVDNGEILEHHFEEGMYPQEPWFIEEPGATEEDHGLIMLQGLDANQQKGFLIILDARDLNLVCHVTGTDLVLFGIHNRFFPSHIGRMGDNEIPTETPDGAVAHACSIMLICASVFTAMF